MTDDFRLYHDLVPLFAEAGLDLLGVAPGGARDVPDSVAVILGGDAGDLRSEPLKGDGETLLLRVLWRLDERTRDTASGAPAKASRPYRRLVVGIDPGATWGLALLADDAPLRVQEAHTPDDAVAVTARWLAALPAHSRHIHIGDGDRAHTVPLLAGLRGACDDAWISLVPEDHTTPQSAATQSRHTDAAIRIALRHPQSQPF